MGISGLFDIGRSSLISMQMAMDVTGQNVANAATPGFTRRAIVLQTVSSGTTISTGSVGRGVDIGEISRMYDSFTSLQLRTEKSNQSYWENYDTGLSKIENLFNESSDTSIGSAITDFFSSWQDVSKNSVGYAERSQLVQGGDYLASRINGAFTELYDQRTQSLKNARNLVAETNSLASQIADLNEKIASAGGSNDLKDQRDGLVEQMNQIVKVNTFEDSFGRYSILLGGSLLVDGAGYYKLNVDAPFNSTNPYGKMVFTVNTTSGEPAAGATVPTLPVSTTDISSGELKANIDLRDTKLIAFQNKLNTFAINLSSNVNLYHKQGYALDGSQGKDFFAFNGSLATMSTTSAAGTITAASLTGSSIDTFVVSTSNNTVNTSAGAITLTAGTYTADGLAAELKSKLDTAVPTNKFTVTYDSSTKKFTVTNLNLGGGEAVTTLFQAGSTAGSMFGFSAPTAALAAGASASSNTLASATTADAFDYVYNSYTVTYNPVNPPVAEGAEDYSILDNTTGKNVSASVSADASGMFRTLTFNNISMRIDGTLVAGEKFNLQLNINAGMSMATSITDPLQVAAAAGDVITIDNSNNSIRFTGDTTAPNPPTFYTARIAAGNYTRNQLATAVNTALSAADPAHTYNVTYSPNTKKYTATNANANPILFDWSSSVSTAAGLLGFNTTTYAPILGGGGTATSDFAVHPIISANGKAGDSTNSRLIADLANQTFMAGSNPNDFYRTIVDDVGIEAGAAKVNTAFYTTVVDQLEKKRQETSGVNLDEEAINLVKYQKSYQAAAKLISVANDLFTTLLGMIG